MKHGEFNQLGDTFAIEEPSTPRPWVNLLSNGLLSSFVSQNGGGYVLVHHPEELLLTRKTTDQQLTDQPGRSIYILDHETNEISQLLRQQPGEDDNSQWKISHQQHLTEISSTSHHLSSSVKIFLSPDQPVEIWQCVLNNLSEKRRRLSIFTAVELAESWTNFEADWHENTLSVSRPNRPTVFFSTSRPADSFDCDWATFVGYFNSLSQPQAVRDGKCSRSLKTGVLPLMALQQNITLGPKSTLTFAVFFGASRNAKQAAEWVGQLRQSDQVEQLMEKSSVAARSLAESLSVLTPDTWLNRSRNYWLVKQALAPNWQRQCLTYNYTGKLTALNQIQLASGKADYLLQPDSLVKQLELIQSDGTLSDLTVIDEYVKAVWRYLAISNDPNWLDQPLAYADHGNGSILEHLIRLTKKVEQELGLAEEEGWLELSLSFLHAMRYLLPILESVNEHDLKVKLERTQAKILPLSKKALLAESRSPKLPEYKKVLLLLTASEVQLLSAKELQPLINRLKVASLSNIDLLALAKIDFQHKQVERAFQLLEQVICHVPADSYAHEPFCLPLQVVGLNGLGSWEPTVALSAIRLIDECLFGLSATNHGLRIDPHLPKSWRQVDIAKQFRGALYNIRINNPFRVNCGIDRILLDGTRFVGNVVPLRTTGTHFVEVFLG